MNHIQGILFDLDGTLLDSAPDLVASLNQVRKSEKLPLLEVAEMSSYVSRGAVGLLKAGMPATDDRTFESWRMILLQHYAENSFQNSTLFAGVAEMLEYLNQARIPWGIVTNKSEALTLPIIEASDLRASISCVVCGDTLSKCKPDPEPVILACEMLGVPTKNTLFIGDDIRDLEAGRAAGTLTAAVHYGYGTFEMTDRLVSGSFQMHHPGDLLGLLQHD